MHMSYWYLGVDLKTRHPANIGFYHQKHAINKTLEPMEAKNNHGIKLMLWQKEITIHSDKMNAIKFEDN